MWRPVLVADRALRSAEDCSTSASSLSPAGCSVICATMTILTCAAICYCIDMATGNRTQEQNLPVLGNSSFGAVKYIERMSPPPCSKKGYWYFAFLGRSHAESILRRCPDSANNQLSLKSLCRATQRPTRSSLQTTCFVSQSHRATTMPTERCRGVLSKAVGYQSGTLSSNIGVVTFSEQRRHMAAQQSVGAVKKWTPRIGA